MTCKSSFLTIFFWHHRLPIPSHQINLCVFLLWDWTIIKNALIITTKVPTYFVDQTQANCQLGSTTVTTTTILTPNIVLFFSQVSIAVLPMLSSCPGDDGDAVVLSPLKLSRAVDCSHFRQILQSPPSQVWAAGDSYCLIFQAGLSVSFLLGLDCRRFILPHISGRSVSLLPLRCGLQANLTAPYFRQVCQLSLVHCSWSFLVQFTRCDILITILWEMWVLTSPVLESWSSFHPLRNPGHGTKKELTMCCTLSTHTHGGLDERGGQRSHAANPQHSLNNNKFR